MLLAIATPEKGWEKVTIHMLNLAKMGKATNWLENNDALLRLKACWPSSRRPSSRASPRRVRTPGHPCSDGDRDTHVALIIWSGAESPLLTKTFGAVLRSFRPDVPAHHFLPWDFEQLLPEPLVGDVILSCGKKPLATMQRAGIAPKNRTRRHCAKSRSSGRAAATS